MHREFEARDGDHNKELSPTEFRYLILSRLEDPGGKLRMKSIKQNFTNALIEEIKSDLMMEKKFTIQHVGAYAAVFVRNITIEFAPQLALRFSGADTPGTPAAIFRPRHDRGSTHRGHRRLEFHVVFEEEEEEEEDDRKRILFERHNKILRGVSSYKVDELRAMAALFPNEQKDKTKTTKNDLYDFVLDQCRAILHTYGDTYFV
jgi:hypothetical protein